MAIITRHTLFILLALALCILDAGYTYWQFVQLPTDGDLVAIVLPSWQYQTVLTDPLGLKAAIGHQVYGGTNRYVIHALYSWYMRTVPIGLQRFMSPVESIYVAIALAKIIMHIGLIWVMASYVRVFAPTVGLPIAALLIFPFFQTAGYQDSMGIVSGAVTYAFFYALPSLLCLIAFLPLTRALVCALAGAAGEGPPARTHTHAGAGPPARTARLAGEGPPAQTHLPWSPTSRIFTYAMIPILALSGPLVPGVLLLIAPVLLWQAVFGGVWSGLRGFSFFGRLRQISATAPLLFSAHFRRLKATVLGKHPKTRQTQLSSLALWILAWSAYSLYVGRYNFDVADHEVGLAERFARLPLGMYQMLHQKIGLPLLLLLTLWQTYRLRTMTQQGRVVHGVALVLLWACVAWIVLLPFGGYRPYRPLILRSDSGQPILLILIFLYTLTTCLLWQSERRAILLQTRVCAVAVWLIFTLVDYPLLNTNTCERGALQTLSQAQQSPVQLSPDCHLLNWELQRDTFGSLDKALMLKHWGVTKEVVLFWQ